MGGESMGSLVPSVKSDGKSEAVGASSEAVGASTAMVEVEKQNEEEELGGRGKEMDKDLLCPICMQIIKDAFLTACGHSFCYMCIITHFNNKNDCPCCSHYLTNNQLFPNFLLNKVSVFYDLIFLFKRYVLYRSKDIVSSNS